MVNRSGLLAVAVAMRGAMGVLTGDGWPGFVIGAALALALWIMLFFGVKNNLETKRVPVSQFAVSAVAAVAVGFLTYRLSGDNPAMWPTGSIVAGAGMIAVMSTSRAKR